LLTPILNALRPDAFQIFATQSRNFLNYFADTGYTQAISDYPAANQQLTALFARLSEHMHENDSRVAVNQQ
ncbi:MAG: hypothetical protein KDE31_27335, partial [Caldilineaceae bacterium]|nr:hypothetical protein [Caldilineaceae bacterium]